MSRRSAKEEALLREIAKVSALLDKHTSGTVPPAPPAALKSSPTTFLRVPPSRTAKSSGRVWINPELAANGKPSNAPKKVGSPLAASQTEPKPKNERNIVMGTTVDSKTTPTTAGATRHVSTASLKGDVTTTPSSAKSEVKVIENTSSSSTLNRQPQPGATSASGAAADGKKPGLLQRRLSATGVVPAAVEAPDAPFRKTKYSLVMNKPPAAVVAKITDNVTTSAPNQIPTPPVHVSRFKLSRTPIATSTQSASSKNTMKPTPSVRVAADGPKAASPGVLKAMPPPAIPGASEHKKSSIPQRNLANHALQLVWDRKREDKRKQPCVFFTKFGHCKNGDNCHYLHDQTKVAVCRKFLLGKCTDEKCTLQHTMDKDKMPICFYFNSSPDGSGCKLGDKCPYLHVRVSPDAEVCPDFITFGGYCPRGAECTMKHTDECQAFSRFGECPLGDKCKMRHREKKKHKKHKEHEADEGGDVTAENVLDEDKPPGGKKRKRTPNLEPAPSEDSSPSQQLSSTTADIGSSADNASASVESKGAQIENQPEGRVKRIKPNFL